MAFLSVLWGSARVGRLWAPPGIGAATMLAATSCGDPHACAVPWATPDMLCHELVAASDCVEQDCVRVVCVASRASDCHPAEAESVRVSRQALADAAVACADEGSSWAAVRQCGDTGEVVTSEPLYLSCEADCK